MQRDQSVKAEWYRARAADCLELAQRAPDAKAKVVLEDMAATWLKLAELVDTWDLK